MGSLFLNSQSNNYFKTSTVTTDLFLKSLVISGSRMARSEWEKSMVMFFVERNQNITGGGLAGFDVMELGWTKESFFVQLKFLHSVVEDCLKYQTWNAFNYATSKAEIMIKSLQKFKELIAEIDFTKIRDNRIVHNFHQRENYEYCSLHQTLKLNDLILGQEGCLVCSTVMINDQLDYTYEKYDTEGNSCTLIIEVTFKEPIKDGFDERYIIDSVFFREQETKLNLLGNLWRKIEKEEADQFLKAGLSYDLAYTSCRNVSETYAQQLYDKILLFLNNDITYNYTSCSASPWSASGYGSCDITDWTLDAGLVVGNKFKMVICIFRGED